MIVVFWVVMPYCLEDGYQIFGGMYCPPTNSHGITTQKTTVYFHSCENLKSDIEA
jgi:hypothetical protein